MPSQSDGPFDRLIAWLGHLLRLDGGTRKVAGSDRPLLSLALLDYYVILVATILLASIGALMSLSSSSVYAQSQDLSPYYYAQRQVLFLVVGGGVAAIASRLRERWIRIAGLAAYAASVLMLILVFTPLGSDAGKGNRNWLALGPVTLQPSEFAKLALVIAGSSYLAARREDLGRARHLVPYLLMFAVPVILIIAQGDLGTVMIIGAVMFAQMWAFGIRLRYLLGLMVLAAGSVAVAVATRPSRMRRVLLFLSPTDSPDASQQPLSAIFALASGGWWGVGIGASRQKWGGLYDGAQNDYVFAVLGEEMGLVGTMAVIVLFALLTWAGIRVAMRSSSQFSRALAATITAWTAIQAVMNMGVALNLFPVFGVPLPFISIGGSALISNLVAAGLLLACARGERAAAKYLDASRRSGPLRVTTVVDGGRRG
ncbi:Cell division protein FtsW [Acidipropionibacterium jensenii]|uniref:Probable peptidoglycan glycosyltransferase FtsW n=1 Tax=Acidipropionibacterium jensenii TaxID=1749 RepID=A0A3S4VI36_9ACTN|nr:putative lipid II flippase FtsW [Acidipropionibacterium jensenii]VEI02516.1 Cell division protein FtsW [Acidipropionibacterium jensenii]